MLDEELLNGGVGDCPSFAASFIAAISLNLVMADTLPTFSFSMNSRRVEFTVFQNHWSVAFTPNFFMSSSYSLSKSSHSLSLSLFLLKLG